MIFVGVLLAVFTLLALLLLIRPCMNMCRRIRLRVTAQTRNHDRSIIGANGVPQGGDSKEGIGLPALSEKASGKGF